MGGGGAMRTAAKIAGFGVTRSGVRGSTAALPTEQSVRNVSRPVSPPRLSSQETKPTEVAPLHTAASWDVDDWEFADGGDLVMAAGEPMPRVVFGSVPSFQEAKEATSELKDAIDKIYLSSDSSKSEVSSPGSQVSVTSPTLSEPLSKSRVIEAISNPSVPNHVTRAFQLLSTSSEAQTIVASIASDANVWKAVMENPALNNYFQSQQTVADFEAKMVEDLTSSAAFAGSETPEKVEGFAESHPGDDFFDLKGLLEKIKLSVTDMISSVSNYLQNIFPTAEKEKTADADGKAKANFNDNKTFMGGTFMGLAMLVIMVVLLKRV